MTYNSGKLSQQRRHWYMTIVFALLTSSCLYAFLQQRSLLRADTTDEPKNLDVLVLDDEESQQQEERSSERDKLRTEQQYTNSTMMQEEEHPDTTTTAVHPTSRHQPTTLVMEQKQVTTHEDDSRENNVIPSSLEEEGTKQHEEPHTNAAKNNKEQQQQQQQKQETTKPMNILLLYADDWTAKTLGVAGNKVVQTPILDKLAQEGVRFSENCVTTSLCWTSRATLYTGLYMARHNTTRRNRFYVSWKVCLYNLMKKHGYVVGHVGKLGIGARDLTDKIDFHANDEGWHYRNISNRAWHITEKNEADSLEFLKTRDKTKPFFLNTAFYATHAKDDDKRQYMPQNKSMSMYQNVTIPTPVTATQEAWDNMPHFFTVQNAARGRFNMRYNEPDKFQHMMKNYYRMASEVDSTCGVIMEEIRRQGELENTLIIFTTDNGNFHGEHGLADKWYPHQESIRVPLIIKDPRMPTGKAGMVNDDFTLNVDLAPTILSAAGVPPPPEMMGRDISDLYLKDDVNWRTEFFYEHPMHREVTYVPASEALVRKDYKYFYWPDYKVEQLFNIKNDPYEQHDIVSSNETEHQTILNEMKNRFIELKDIVHDMSKSVII